MEWLPEILHSFLAFIVIISAIVFVHEFGHFWVARRCGVHVETFSIGFGPEVFGWNDKHKTRWKVSLLPLGGFVKMYGDGNAASAPDKAILTKMTKAEKARSFYHKNLKQKAAIVVAGPVSNFLFAIIVLTGFFLYYGRPETAPEIGEVAHDSAAEFAGLKKGDVIKKLNGADIVRFEDLRSIANMHPGEKMDVIFMRDKQLIRRAITPKLTETNDIFGNKIRVGLLGVSSSSVVYKPMGVTEALPAGFMEVFHISSNTLKAIGQMIVGSRSPDELSGILRIGQYSGQAANKGISVVLWFMAVLSVNLGLINLLPIPVLDGGHLMFYAVEAVKGRPMAERVQEWGYRVGFSLLVLLMVFATYNDLRHLNVL